MSGRKKETQMEDGERGEKEKEIKHFQFIATFSLEFYNTNFSIL